jgi:ketosteroid isomerase-like protein
MRIESRHQRLIIEATHTAWAAGDLATIGACIHDDAQWLVHLPPGAWPLAGAMQGKPQVMRSLRTVARDFEVLEYVPLKIVRHDGFWLSRARIGYRHRATGLVYDGTVSNFWQFERDKIIMCEAFHDAARLRAFFEMVSRIGAEA